MKSFFNTIKSLFSASQNTIETTTEKHSSPKVYAEQVQVANADIVDGYKFCATIAPSVPLRYLQMHGEGCKALTNRDREIPQAYGIWTPCLSPKFSAIFEEDATVWSVIGSIPANGGDFLPYLVHMRQIIETPKEENQTDLQSIFAKIEQIKALPQAHSYKENRAFGTIEKCLLTDYFALIFKQEDDALEFMLSQLAEYSYKGLKASHIRELYSQGFQSIENILKAPDNVLLGLKGVGAKKLIMIRNNMSFG